MNIQATSAIVAGESPNQSSNSLPISNAPRKDLLQLNGFELMQILLAAMAEKLASAEGVFSELICYPGARVDFLVRIQPQPFEEANLVKVIQDQVTIDLSNPPDILRILSGLPIWDRLKVRLEAAMVGVEVPVMAGQELENAAKAVTGLDKVVPSGQKSPSVSKK